MVIRTLINRGPRLPYPLSIIALGLLVLGGSCAPQPDTRTPAEIATAVAGQVINSVSFEFERVPQEPVQGVEFVDFRRIIGTSGPATAIAVSSIESAYDSSIAFGVSASDQVNIWINDDLAYSWDQPRVPAVPEVGYGMFSFQDSFTVDLRKGSNRVVVEVTTQSDPWIFFLRPLDNRGEPEEGVTFSLASFAPERGGAHWLVQGPIPAQTAVDLMGAIGTAADFGYPWLTPPTEDLWQLKVEHRRRTTNDWHYAHGATMLGMLAVADYLGDERIGDFVKRYCDFTIANYDYFKWQYEVRHAYRGSYHRIFRRSMLDDSGAPALPYLELLRRGEGEQFRPLIEEIDEYVSHQQLRLADGTFARPEPEPYTVWADDLFMSVPFLLRRGQMTGDRAYYDDAARQLIQFTDLLFVAEKGLLKHTWFSQSQERSLAYWGRANGWSVWAMSEALEYLPKDHRDYQQILAYFRRHMEGLVAQQDPTSGMWHQVLDYHDSFEETSCTSMFVLGLARGVRLGWLDEVYREAALRGWDGLRGKVDRDGLVRDITRGTGVGDNLQFYYDRDRFLHDPRGVGSVMLAAVEIAKLQSEAGAK